MQGNDWGMMKDYADDVGTLLVFVSMLMSICIMAYDELMSCEFCGMCRPVYSLRFSPRSL